jgi:glycosyltransferase involved in cell wall biosynthesis
MRVAFLGGARYSQPLDATSEKKWRLLSELGEMFIIGFSQDLRPRRFTQHAHFYLLPKFPLPVLRYLAMFTVGPVLTLWLILRHGVRILVAQSPYECFAASVAKVLARLFGKKVALIVESHGDFEVSLFLQRRVLIPALYRFLMHKIARFSLHHADLLRAVSNSTHSQLRSWMPKKTVVQFPAWTDIDVFLKAGEIKKNKGEKIIIYVGVLIPQKGVHFLLDAFSQVVKAVPEARLWILGKEENLEYAKGLKEQTERLGLKEKVKFFEPVSQERLANYMAQSYVLVLPSISEGLGRVVFEAMASGIPVIGSNVGGIPEMIKDGKTGFLVLPGDVSALADRLKWILQHLEEAKKMGENAHKFAKAFFSVEKYVQNYAKLFEMAVEILNNQSR